MNRDVALALVKQKYEQLHALETDIDQIVASVAADWVNEHYHGATTIVFDEDYDTGRLSPRRLADVNSCTIVERVFSPDPLAQLDDITMNFTEGATHTVMTPDQTLELEAYLPRIGE